MGAAQLLLSGCLCQLLLEIHNLFDLNQEPTVYLGQAEDFLNRESSPQRMTDEKDSLGVRDGEFAGNHVAGKNVSVAINFCSDPPRLAVAAESAAPDFEGAETFLEGFFEGSSDGHGLTNGFHLSRQGRIGLGKFLEGKARNLGDDVINARLETAERGIYAASTCELASALKNSCACWRA